LSAAVLKVLKGLPDGAGETFIFPGGKRDSSLSNMAMLACLKRMDRNDITVHGFRSSFRDWAAEQTNVAREVAEQALAHTISDQVEAAYRRGDLFEKRRRLMGAWGTYCTTVKTRGDNVVPMARKA
jgi:integrase